jgi:uncharacterized LabA/DUF88 family protein
MSGRAIILIDGGYFDYINSHCNDSNGAKIDLVAFSKRLCTEFGLDILRTKYYHAEPYIDDHKPTKQQEERLSDTQSCFYTIKIHERGQFEEKGRVKMESHDCPECNERFRQPSQKGTDVGIAVDLVEMAANKNAPEAFILVSGDEDLKHAVRAAKNNHAVVNLGFAYNPSADLYSAQALRNEVDDKTNVVDFLGDVTL